MDKKCKHMQRRQDAKTSSNRLEDLDTSVMTHITSFLELKDIATSLAPVSAYMHWLAQVGCVCIAISLISCSKNEASLQFGPATRLHMSLFDNYLDSDDAVSRVDVWHYDPSCCEPTFEELYKTVMPPMMGLARKLVVKPSTEEWATGCFRLLAHCRRLRQLDVDCRNPVKFYRILTDEDEQKSTRLAGNMMESLRTLVTRVSRACFLRAWTRHLPRIKVCKN